MRQSSRLQYKSEEQVNERLRQEKETFQQLKRQDNWWFCLKLAMGFLSILLLTIIAVVSTFIILDHRDYPSSIVVLAATSLFSDILALVISIWKIVLSPVKLEPITRKLG